MLDFAIHPLDEIVTSLPGASWSQMRCISGIDIAS